MGTRRICFVLFFGAGDMHFIKHCSHTPAGWLVDDIASMEGGKGENSVVKYVLSTFYLPLYDIGRIIKETRCRHFISSYFRLAANHLLYTTSN